MRGECAHCGLPLGRRPVAGTVDGERAACCCYGCLLALQVTRARGDSGAASAIVIRLGLAIFFSMNVMMVSLPTYVPYVYGVDRGAGDGPLFQVLRVLGMVFAAPVLILLGWPIVSSAARGVRNGGPNADMLIVLGTVAAYALSVRNTVIGSGAVYFDTTTMLLLFVTLGRYLEARAKAEAGAAVRASLAPLPAFATRLHAGAAETVRLEFLAPGDFLRVGPGDAFPTDGIVVDGSGGVDEAALTGESLPVFKEPGTPIAGGTCSVDGLFEVRVTAAVQESTAARIERLLAAARRERTPIERLADRLASVLVPIVMLVAIIAAGWWTQRAGAEHGVLVGLAVLAVACPCALGIATPIAVWTGLVTAARHGVIVRSAALLERIAQIGSVLFDKTGTLTNRTPSLIASEPTADSGLSALQLLGVAAALETGIPHPIARAIVAAAQMHEAGNGRVVRDVRVVPGRGVYGHVDGCLVAVGNLGAERPEVRDDIAHSGTEGQGAAPYGNASVVPVWGGERMLGTLLFTENVRPDAAPALSRLRGLRLRVGLLSGDQTADAVVPGLIRREEAEIGLLPEQKVARVRAARRALTRTHQAVAMVGDGINDAPALAAADIGIAVGSATDLARINADVAVVRDDLQCIPWLIVYAGRVERVTRQNLFWAVAYNAVAVTAAAAGVLNPAIASLVMLASSLTVVANASRLRVP